MPTALIHIIDIKADSCAEARRYNENKMANRVAWRRFSESMTDADKTQVAAVRTRLELGKSVDFRVKIQTTKRIVSIPF